jgi:hypothetical protein
MRNSLEGVINRHEAYSKAEVLARLGISQRFWDKLLDEGLPYTIVGHTRWVTGEALINHLNQCAEHKQSAQQRESNDGPETRNWQRPTLSESSSETQR